MSTVPEVIVANHMNLTCAVVSVLTDECNPDKPNQFQLKKLLQLPKKLNHLNRAIYKNNQPL